MNKISLLCALMFFTLLPAHAAEPEEEISHLLLYVQNTECEYDRNGTIYTGEEAAEHIQTKYDYFKNRINTAERFIELSATKSTMSGRQYTVQCRGLEKLTSKDWLLKELESYRTRGAAATSQ